MKIAVVHISDIHFRLAGNPIAERAHHLVSAVTSEDPSVSPYLVIISGDVAFSGNPGEYQMATQFFDRLKGELQEVQANAQVWFFGVPGNHDCFLPRSATTLRSALITGILPTLHETKPDPAILGQLLTVQSDYAVFHRHLYSDNEWEGICGRRFIEVGQKRIQLNLYNTAVLSRLDEGQGQLQVPLKVIAETVELDKNVALCIAVFHHSYGWLESNVQISFRSHIERTSDVALMGHQHFQHSYYKQNSTGERVLYLEGGALQQEDYPQSSEFQLLLFDLDSQGVKSLHFHWSGDLYRRTETADWSPFKLNRGIRADFRITEEFERELNDLGTPLTHRVKGTLGLRDIFIYPDFVVRTQAPKPSLREVRGESLLQYISEVERVVFQFPALGGKTSLSKVLFSDLLSDLDVVPLLIDGKQIHSAQDNRVLNSLWKRAQEQYGEHLLEPFRQLSRQKRVLIIDDWHQARLNSAGRRKVLELVGQYFGKIILFTDDLFQIQELVNKSPDTLLSFDYATALEFSHTSRGQLIERWVTIGREHISNEGDLAREIEDTEGLVSSLIGKNTLPSQPFIVLCILQADQEDKVDAPEAGSFGYLYEVLVTTALNKSSNRKTQLEKKYMFLSRLAYEMFRNKVDLVSATRARQIAEEYAHSHLVKVDIDALLLDLETSRVLINLDHNFHFGYPHLFFYFIARYYKDNLSGEQGPRLREEIREMADHISSDKHSTVLMFLLYLTRDSTDLIERLTKNADRIYQKEIPANLESDVAFLNAVCNESEVKIPEKIDLAENRRERREARDRIEKEAKSLANGVDRDFVYSDDLSDSDKFFLAHRHLELLGQVLRNFPGSLPGPEKLAILHSTYLLGLRLLKAILRLFEFSYQDYTDIVTKAVEESHGRIPGDAETIRSLVDRLIVFLNRMVVLGILMKLSSDVGLADLEDAYSEVLASLDNTNAIRLLDLAIKLDHFGGFPETEVKELHSKFLKNPFADTVLKDLVIIHIQKFDISRSLRQRMAALFGVKANVPALMDPSRKK